MPAEIENHCVYCQNNSVICREIAGETLLVPVRGELADMQRIFALDPVPKFIWDQIDGQHTVDDLHRAVVETFEVDADGARTDLRDFLQELLEAGLIGPTAG